jgi:ubiquinone/menaquinone biosynthesis C-methylase UbiE
MISDFFNKHCREYDAWYEKNRFTYLSELEAVKKALPEKGYGLEIGVGSGRFAAPLGISVGIDPSKKMVEIAGQRGVEAQKGTGERLSFEDSVFDYVVIIVTLCFVADPVKVIAEAARVLKPGGRIITGIVDKRSFLGRFYLEKNSIFYEYARFFDIEELTMMLKKEGFVDFAYYQTIFNYPDKIDAVQLPEEGYGKGGFVVISANKS